MANLYKLEMFKKKVGKYTPNSYSVISEKEFTIFSNI